jgi:hypothetical protein
MEQFSPPRLDELLRREARKAVKRIAREVEVSGNCGVVERIVKRIVLRKWG